MTVVWKPDMKALGLDEPADPPDAPSRLLQGFETWQCWACGIGGLGGKKAIDAHFAASQVCWLALNGYSRRMASSLNNPQPPPQPSNAPAAWDLVMADMRERDAIGAKKYGVRLTPGDGRDSLVDAYQEALDMTVYLRKAIYERDGQ